MATTAAATRQKRRNFPHGQQLAMKVPMERLTLSVDVSLGQIFHLTIIDDECLPTHSAPERHMSLDDCIHLLIQLRQRRAPFFCCWPPVIFVHYLGETPKQAVSALLMDQPNNWNPEPSQGVDSAVRL